MFIGLAVQGFALSFLEYHNPLIGWPQRAGLHGTAFTFFTTENARSARELIALLSDIDADNDVPPELEEMAMISGGGRCTSNHRNALLNEVHAADLMFYL